MKIRGMDRKMNLPRKVMGTILGKLLTGDEREWTGVMRKKKKPSVAKPRARA